MLQVNSVCKWELAGAWGGDQSCEVFKCGILHLVVTGAVSVGSGTDTLSEWGTWKVSSSGMLVFYAFLIFFYW